MHIRDTTTGYGLVTRLVHWLMALAIFFLFALGIWMVGLEYYSPYYTSAPICIAASASSSAWC